ncbi:serine threonine protein kinase [Moniliophthora roreri MCA 2997]|uniref:Serine threonine protein kinase n=1 Tax=Moniliophthora roreri (strain MCA 2997) TaxID=1381753 RepID=V2WP92_MONRO|nr:serine threonine protein kinase [Moniliophthora roreri MCA 2997]
MDGFYSWMGQYMLENRNTSRPFGGLKAAKLNFDAVEAARSLENQLSDAAQALNELSDEMPAKAIEDKVARTEAIVADIRQGVSQIKRSHAVEAISEVNNLLLEVENACRDWQSKYPNSLPIKIDNSKMFNNYSSSEHTSMLIAYCLALVNRVFDGASRRSASFILKMVKLFRLSLTLLGHEDNRRQNDVIAAIPEDIRTLKCHFNLDVETVLYAVCPSYSFTHPPSHPKSQVKSQLYPEKCLEHPTTHLPPCNTPLLQNGLPIKTFEYYPFFDWFGCFLALPGVLEYRDQFCNEVDSSSEMLTDRVRLSDGRFFREMKGPNDQLFIADRGEEGRWFFALYSDFFNIEGNHIGGKHSLMGVMALFCLNLPLTIRNNLAYVYVPGLIQGPQEPDGKESHHRHYLKPLVNELLVGYTWGKFIKATYGVCYLELEQLPYFQASTQVVIDLMHTMYHCMQQQFWRGPLGLDNPGGASSNRSESRHSDIAFYYKFTLPPSLSSIGSGDTQVQVDNDKDPMLPSTFEWHGLPPQIQQWQLNQLKDLESHILANEKLLAQVRRIHRLLSQSKPLESNAKDMQKKLAKNKWLPLFYVSCNLHTFLPHILDRIGSRLSGIGTNHISKSEMADSLVCWRVEEILEQGCFSWPDFSTKSRGPLVIPPSQPLTNLKEQISGMTASVGSLLSETQRESILTEIAQKMTYNTALGIGHIHCALCQPMDNTEDGKTKLIKKLQS